MSRNRKKYYNELHRETVGICEENGIVPMRSRGQNFLINEEVFDDIVELADLSEDDVVLEVGPGLGFLTERLAGKVKKVVAVELDVKLARVLKKRIEELGLLNVEVVQDDILDFQENDEKYGFLDGGFKVVANLPYNITSVFLRKFLEGAVKPKTMTLMLQKEVAERIVALVPKMSLLAVSVQYYAKARIVSEVARGDFWPAPEVDSAVVRIDLEGKRKGDAREFFRIVKIGFSQKRKMLKNNLANGLHIGQDEACELVVSAGLGERVRAQELSIGDWERVVLVCGDLKG